MQTGPVAVSALCHVYPSAHADTDLQELETVSRSPPISRSQKPACSIAFSAERTCFPDLIPVLLLLGSNRPPRPISPSRVPAAHHLQLQNGRRVEDIGTEA